MIQPIPLDDSLTLIFLKDLQLKGLHDYFSKKVNCNYPCFAIVLCIMPQIYVFESWYVSVLAIAATAWLLEIEKGITCK